jgi:hypothetical protein
MASVVVSVLGDIVSGWKDNNNLPLIGGMLLTQASGVNYPTYIEPTGTVANTNPIILNNRGEIATSSGTSVPLYVQQNIAYTFTLFDSLGNQIWATPAITAPATIAGVLAALTPGVLGAILYPTTTAETVAGVTPTNFQYPPGNFLRYGADPSGATDSTNAIQSALNCSPIAYDGGYNTGNIYKISATLVFKAQGQTLQGQGAGDNVSGQTTLFWAGTAGGVMVSVYDPAAGLHHSDTVIQNIILNGLNSATGNYYATVGYQGYNSIVSTGCFRNRLQSVTIENITNGVLPIGADMGAGTVLANSNDYEIRDCFFSNCANGVRGGGATQNLHRTTISGCSMTGFILSLGGYATTTNCIFSNNGQDVLNTSGSYTDLGSWFENSTTGVFGAITSHTTSFLGSYLHTLNNSGTSYALVNWNNAAGNGSLRNCKVPVVDPTGLNGTVSNKVGNHNASYEYDYTGTTVQLDNFKRLHVPYANSLTQTGMVDIDNAKFFCGPTNNSSTTGNGTVISLGSVTKLYDLCACVAAGTGVFTAPCQGYYEFDAQLSLFAILSTHTDALLNLIVTGGSAATYQMNRINPFANLVNATTEAIIVGRARVPMSYGDTAYVQLTVSNGTQVVYILGSGVANNWRSFFQGKLA